MLFEKVVLDINVFVKFVLVIGWVVFVFFIMEYSIGKNIMLCNDGS